MAKIKQRLVLAQWMIHQLGFSDYETGFNTINEALKKADLGWDEQNVFHFRHALEAALEENPNRALTNDALIQYDLNILTHWKAITKKRQDHEHRALYPLPFQYLILLFTEYYLDLWTSGLRDQSTKLLDELNDYRTVFNGRFSSLTATEKKKAVIPKFQIDDLHKLAIWAATGSGKTLLMHCQYQQLQHYISERKLGKRFNKIFLITPNEGLSNQHLEDLALSNIPARRFQKDSAQSLLHFENQPFIEVIEITKLKTKTGVTTIDIAELGTNNIILIDEGHRGLAGEVEFTNRQALCAEGFSLEYSATFGQSVNSLAAGKAQEMSNLYAQSILFDYSYKHFHRAGYGKEYEILNYDRKPNAGNAEDQQHSYLIACIARFFQQCLLFHDKSTEYKDYLIENPLMILVGGSVTGRKTYDDDLGNEGNREDTDVIQAIQCFARFCNEAETSIRSLDLLLRNQLDLGGEQNVFNRAFDYLRKQYPVTQADAASRLFTDILKLCFHSQSSAPLHADYFTGSISEIGLRVGQSPDYFGVIKVGEGKKLWDLISAQETNSIQTNERDFGVSLFDGIKSPTSKTRVLIGAKMFTEGWSCWRVSSMGLINVGKKEGSQIIQLFGRGVRLKGLDFGLKRSNSLHQIDHPEHLIELETLNVFGIRADYMDTFRDYLDEEGVTKESERTQLTLPTIENLARTDLKVILPKKDKPDFKKEQTIQLAHQNMNGIVTADWYGRVSSKSSLYKLNPEDSLSIQPRHLTGENKRFLNYDQIYLATLKYKQRSALYNLEIDKEQIIELLEKHNWYFLYIPENLLKFDSFSKVQIWQEIATDLVLRYIKKFYNFHRDQHDAPFQEYRTIQQVLDDPGETYNAQFLRNLRTEYLTAIDNSQEQLITDLTEIKGTLENGTLQEYHANEVNLFNFDNHLYQPLIHVTDGYLKVSVKPTSLNKHEKQFCDDLKTWIEKEKDGFLQSKELYLLRNQSRGKGISFFAEGNFYPDFILWILDEEKQHIYFLDPHGLRHAKGFEDGKIQFHKTIKTIQEERLNDPNVILDSFIISPTSRDDIEHWSSGKAPSDFLENHVVFMYDDANLYIDQILTKCKEYSQLSL